MDRLLARSDDLVVGGWSRLSGMLADEQLTVGGNSPEKNSITESSGTMLPYLIWRK